MGLPVLQQCCSVLEGISVILDSKGMLKAVTLPANPPSQFDAAALEKVVAYLASLPLDWQHFTNFQRDVYRAMMRIRRGETVCYKALAAASGHPDAVRAAASACARNPIPLLIPCHRVVASDGSLGGFSSGLAWKQRLLEIEMGESWPAKRHRTLHWRSAPESKLRRLSTKEQSLASIAGAHPMK